MNISKVIGLLGLMAAGFVLAATFAPAEDRKPPADEKRAAPADAKMMHFMECAKACDDCARECTVCGHHCTHMVAEGKKEHLETVRTCQDCASICAAAGSVTARHGPYSDLICVACADACKRCGDACEKHAAHDEAMKRCMEECRKCEKVCREMLKHTGK